MKQERVSQFRAWSQDWLIRWLKQVVASLKGVGEVDRAHPGFSRHAVQFLQTHLRIADGNLDPCNKPVGKLRVGLHGSVINNLREVRTVGGRRPPPRHAAAQRY